MSEAYRSSQIIFWATNQTHSQRYLPMKEGAIPWQRRCEKQGWSQSSARMLRKQATCRHPFPGPLLRPVSCGWVAASGSWVMPLLAGTRGRCVGGDTRGDPWASPGFHSCPKVGGIKSGVLPAHCSYCSTGVPLGPGGQPPCFLRRRCWEESFLTSRLRDVSCVSGNIHSVCFRGWCGVGWFHFAFVRHTHSCLCWPRIFAMYPQNPRPTKVQKHVEQSTHLELHSMNGHKNVSGAGSTCGHLARGSNTGGPPLGSAWLVGAPGDSKEAESSLSLLPWQAGPQDPALKAWILWLWIVEPGSWGWDCLAKAQMVSSQVNGFAES